MSDDKQGMDNGVVRNEADAREVIQLIGDAAEAGALALMPTTRKSDGAKVYLLVSAFAGTDPDGKRGENIYPLAALFESDPFDLYNPPEGGKLMNAPDHSPFEGSSNFARADAILAEIEARLAREIGDGREDAGDAVGGASESKEDYGR